MGTQSAADWSRAEHWDEEFLFRRIERFLAMLDVGSNWDVLSPDRYRAKRFRDS